MAEQQLIDYINKARDAGQTDDQTRNLLYKNGWTVAEVSDALASLNQPQPKPQPQPQPQIQPQPQPQIQIQPQVVSQPEPQYKPQSLEMDMPRTSSRGTLGVILKILIVLVIIVVLGGAGYLVAGQYLKLPYSNFLWNFSAAPNPQTVISNMLADMKNVKSSHTIMQIKVTATDNSSKKSLGGLTLDTNSEGDTTDINSPKADGNFIINFIPAGSAAPIVSSSVSIAVIGDVSYFKINNITIPAGYSYYPGLDISKIKGNWFKIDQDSIKALFPAEAGQAAIVNIPQMYNSELTKQIQDLLLAPNILSVDKQLNDQVISGQDTYHYSVTISKAKLKDLMTKLIAMGMQAQSGSISMLLNTVQAFANIFADAIGDINMEMWIGKNDYMLYQIKLGKIIDSSKILEASGAGALIGANNMQIEVKFNLTNSNFNKPITVQAPANAQKIETIVLPLIKMQKIQSDMNRIGLAAQSVFSINKNYSLTCKNGFLNGSKKTSYGLEFISAVNDMIKQGAKNPICFAGIQDYCVSTQLSDGSYLCIDKTGAVGTTKCVSSKTVCK